MPQYLITLSIGPVQDFIAAARRTRDLWFGSQVLSDVSKAAAISLNHKKEDCSGLIFPAPKDLATLESNDFNVGNKILAIVETDDPAQAVEDAKKMARDNWSKKAKQAKQKATEAGLKIDDTIWNEQVNDVLEFFAAWISYKQDDNYTQKRKSLDRLLNARKNTRDFIANPVAGNNIPKSSLDGLRENIILSGSQKAYRRLGIRKGEYLDCVGLVKRLGEDPEQFTPLSRIALNPWLQGIKDTVDFTTINKCLDKLVTDGITSRVKNPTYKQIPYDGQLLYPFRLEKALSDFKEEERTYQKLKALDDAITAADLSKQNSKASPYMAIIAADGDKMGELLTSMKELDQHRNISSILTDFARNVPDIVTKYKGHCIYAGGDDVLALIPLNKAIECAEALADIFYETMSKVKGISQNNIPTLSVGLGISHLMTPMGKQLDLARKAEQLAKSNEKPETERKNGLAIIIQPRSGAEISFRERWDNGAYELIEKWIKTHTHDLLPRKAAYNLREESFSLNWCKLDNETHQKLIEHETQRILEHKRTTEKQSPEDELINTICKRASNKGLAEVANELILTRRIADTYLLAKTKNTADANSAKEKNHA